jgi:hypothetical protein
MRLHLIGLAIVASLAAIPAFAAGPAAATGPEAALTKECGACHMVFPPSLLPARSWVAVMSGLKEHFGENAALDAATNKQIQDLLTAGAADAAGGNRHVMRGLSANQTPLRITELPSWIHEHGKGRVSAAALAKAKAKSPSDCVACHTGAAQGRFEDEGEGEHEGSSDDDD